MKRRFMSAAITFSVTCALGWFCAFAGGVSWGTFNAGIVAALVIAMAAMFAVLAAFFPGVDDHD